MFCLKAVSNLDEESKWTVHYTAPWHQQENVFLPSSRPPCVEDLHRQAKLNLKSVLRECDKLRKDGFRSSQYYSQGPTFTPSTTTSASKSHSEDGGQNPKPTESVTQEQAPACGKRPKTPVSNELSDINTQTNWTKSLPLPTPEERMRQQAQAVQADIVPINVTGETFDRQASIRRSLIHTDTVVRRPKKIKRRKTITGVPDNIQKELAGSGQGDFRGHSMYIPGQYSTLGRLENVRSTLRRSHTRDSSCQTDDIRIVPPSVRRIRAQKGQGIAAQMSQLSNSSGNMSTLSDTAGVLFAPRVNGDLRFHSLPRPGARVSLQSLERTHSTVGRSEESASTLPRPISKIQVDDTVVHLRNNPRTGTLLRPKSQEGRGCQGDKVTSPACVVSPHASYSTVLIPNATLSSSSEVIVIQTSQSPGQTDSRTISSSSYSKVKPAEVSGASQGIILKEDHHSSSGNWSGSSSTRHSQASDTIPSTTLTSQSPCDSAVSLNAGANTEVESHNCTLDHRNGSCFTDHIQENDSQSDSSSSDIRGKNRNMNSTEQWVYQSPGNADGSPQKPQSETSGYSTPVNSVYCSLERTSTKTDTSSVYSVDNDGYYTSMHMDSGLKSERQRNPACLGNTRHSVINVFERDQPSKDDQSSYSDKSLTRSISLKKTKKPPLPPTRTDSLRRNSKKKSQPNGQVLNETLIATLQQSLQLNLNCKNNTSPSQSPSSDYDDPWVVRSRSQSSVSASSSGVSVTAPNVYSICAVTPSQSETSSIKSEYADPWGYYIDYTGKPDDQLKSPVAHPTSTSATCCDYSVSNLSNGSRASIPQVPNGSAKPKITSPDKSNRVTSPSSGYSSQSNTPTTLTPVPVILRAMSPGNGKPKPKVPERKSSLLSSVSVSSSSTSLSSTTSDSQPTMKKSSPPPPSTPPMTPPPPADPVTLPPQPTTPTFPPPPPPTEDSMHYSFTADVPDYPAPPPVSHLPLPPLPPPPPPLPVISVPPLSRKPQKLGSMQEQSPSSSSNNISSHIADKAPSNQQGPSKATMPLITAKALQTVQLRHVKKVEKAEMEQTVDILSESVSWRKQESPASSLRLTSGSMKQPPVPSPASIPFTLEHNHRSNRDEFEKPPTHDQNIYPSPTKSLDSVPQLGVAEVMSSDRSDNAALSLKSHEIAFSGTKLESEPVAAVQDQECLFKKNVSLPQEKHSSPEKPNHISPSRKPPPISKKPTLSLILPPPQPDVAPDEKKQNEDASVRSTLSPVSENFVVGHSEGVKDFNAAHGTDETDSASSTPVAKSPKSVLFLTPDANGSIVQSPLSKAEEDTKEEGQTSASEATSSSDHNGGEISTEKDCSQEEEEAAEENGDVFEPNTPSTSAIPSSSCGEDNGEGLATPTRPRTTEDLFAAIHRSKRRVLGRKDSEEDRLRNHSPSPPVTPTGAAPSLGALRHTGSIHRSTRKSSTSSDNFKALLLKKGSRSDSGSRMSAAEMLKNTDPRRARADSAPEFPDSPANSPSKNKRAHEEWAKSEGVMPRSVSLSSSRYGRSRTPPSAASSKYSARNRTQSSPMTVICEGEGEALETLDDDCLLTPKNMNGRLPDGLDSKRTVEMVDMSNSLSLEDSRVPLEADCMTTAASKPDSETVCDSEGWNGTLVG